MYLNSQILILTESGMPEISDVFDIFSSLVISNWPDGPGDGEHRPGTHLGELATPLSVKPTPLLFAPVVPPTSPPTAAVQPTTPTAWLGPVAPQPWVTHQTEAGDPGSYAPHLCLPVALKTAQSPQMG